MFKPHCDYKIEIRDNIMLCQMRGAWNLEGTLEYFEDIKTSAAPLITSKWCRIVETSEFEGGPLEIMQVLKDIQAWGLANNCVRLFLVSPRAFNKAVLNRQQDNYDEVQYAETIEQAMGIATDLLSVSAK